MVKKDEENTFFAISLFIIKIAYLHCQIVILTIVVLVVAFAQCDLNV